MTLVDQLVDAVGSAGGPDVADRICRACVTVLPVDGAALSLVFDGMNVGTLGVSDPSAATYDEVQFTVGEGPCLESVGRREPVLVADLADPAEHRWPAYRATLGAHGIRGVYAVPIAIGGAHVGALDLFRRRPGHLDADQLAAGLAAADLARQTLLELADSAFREVTEAGDPTWAHRYGLTRIEVSQATGMLVGQLELEPAAALARLRAHAFATGQTASAVARAILERRLRLTADPTPGSRPPE